MTPEQFVYWLQGFIEVSDPAEIDAKKTKMIKDHLKLVFKKVTPMYNQGVTCSTQSCVNDAGIPIMLRDSICVR